MTSVAIGIFDGVHRGHQEILAEAAKYGAVTVLTFDPHPTSIFAPERTPSALVNLHDRIELLKDHGASDVVVIPFTKEFAAMSPDEFIEEILVNQLGATHVTVGANFTFGHKAAGNASYLKEHAQGFGVSAVHLEENRGSAISSSRIRTLIVDGEIVEAQSPLVVSAHLSLTVMSNAQMNFSLAPSIFAVPWSTAKSVDARSATRLPISGLQIMRLSQPTGFMRAG